MNKKELLEALKHFSDDTKILVYNGDTLCAIQLVAQYNANNDPDDGSAVIYLEE